jgi:hypothetical protein
MSLDEFAAKVFPDRNATDVERRLVGAILRHRVR